MSELHRSEKDMDFAHMVAAEYGGWFSGVDQVDRFAGGSGVNAPMLLASLELQVSNYLGRPPLFLPEDQRSRLENEIELATRLLAFGHRGVLMLTQAGNGFGLDVIVDVFNESARRALSSWNRPATDYRDDGPAAPPPRGPQISREWLDEVERGPAPVRRASLKEGFASFLTLFSDALRISAFSSQAKPAPVYTADCNMKGWILESWQQFNFSPKRFGSVPTWPVTDTLPTSGNYMFQGLRGASVRQDLTPHYLGPSRTKTLVKL